jgi:hypothetical protein
MEALVCFDSTTHAIMAERELMAIPFPATVMPLPSEIHAGCGFCLRLPSSCFEEALRLLRERGIPFGGTYTRRETDEQDIYTVWTGDGGMIDE